MSKREINGIIQAKRLRETVEKYRARVVAVNPNSEIQNHASGFIDPPIPDAPIAKSKVREGVFRPHVRFLGFVDPAGNPQSDVFVRVKQHKGCGGSIYRSAHTALGTYLECAKCGGWGSDASVRSKSYPRSFRA